MKNGDDDNPLKVSMRYLTCVAKGLLVKLLREDGTDICFPKRDFCSITCKRLW